MSDLFTTLAQAQTDSGKVQPRLPARFEDNTLESAVETEERGLPYQPDNPQPADALPQARGASQVIKPAAAKLMSGIETVIETSKETPHDAHEGLFTPEYEPRITPDRPPTAPHHSPAPDQPLVERPARTTPQTVRPLSTIVSQESLSSTAEKPEAPNRQADPAASPAIHITPGAPVEAVDTIQAGQSEAAPAIESQRQLPLELEPQVAREAVQPQIMPLAPDVEISAVDSRAHPASGSPVIEVHIGRVELRQAAPQIQETSPARPRFEPAESLSAYLSRRNGGRE